jgi:N-formylglutamate deformylase
MDEDTRERNAGFEPVRQDITGLLKTMAAYFESHASVRPSTVQA